MSSASDRAYEIIRDAIIADEYPGGTRLREEDLAERTALSRTPVREAIRRLGAEGFVSFEPRLGAVVASWDLDQVENLFGIRAVLEGYAASLAASRARPSDAESLMRRCEEMESLVKNRDSSFLQNFSSANKAFHIHILDISGNQRLKSLATPLMDISLIMKTYNRFSDSRILRSCNDHRDLVAAIRANNSLWAEAVMRSHILTSVELYRDHKA